MVVENKKSQRKKEIMKNNDKNVKSFERAKKEKNVKLENSDTALQ
jgi:hypothetical protein